MSDNAEIVLEPSTSRQAEAVRIGTWSKTLVHIEDDELEDIVEIGNKVAKTIDVKLPPFIIPKNVEAFRAYMVDN